LPDGDIQQAHYFAHQDEPFKFLELFLGHEPTIGELERVSGGLGAAQRDENDALQRYAH